MDGVLLDTERLTKIVWMEAAAQEQCRMTEEVYHSLIGHDDAGTRLRLRELGWTDELIERVERRAWARDLAVVEPGGLPCKAGMFVLLDFLAARGVATAVATSTATDIATRRLRSVGALGRFQAIVGGDQVTNGKPAPDIYLRAAEQLQCAPKRCIAIEDSGPGIRAATAAGMTAIWVPDLCVVDETTRGLVYSVAPSLHSAIAIIESLMSSVVS